MAGISQKASARIAAGLKRFQPILEAAKKRDVNESDTVTIVTDLLCELFGYEKYGEVTTEHAVRGTYCDIALKIGNDIGLLVEVKAIGLDLKDQYVKQAVDYAANQGCEWVALTNGVIWRAYRVAFTKPIEAEMILEVNLLEMSHRKGEDIERLSLLSREAWKRSQLAEYATQRLAMSRFTLAAIIRSEPCLQVIRREVRRVSKDVRVETDDIERVLVQEVLKREAIEGDKAEVAKRLVNRASKRMLRTAEQAVAKAPQATSS